MLRYPVAWALSRHEHDRAYTDHDTSCCWFLNPRSNIKPRIPDSTGAYRFSSLSFLILDIPSLFAVFYRADAVTASQKKAAQVHTVLLVFVSLFHGVSVCIGGHFKF